MLTPERGPNGRCVDVLRDHSRRIVAREGRRPRHELVQHRAERVEVRLRRDLLAEGLLGRHVAEGADHHPVLRQPRPALGDRQPEVADLGDAVGRQPDIARLQIPVHDALLMREDEPTRGRLRDLQRMPERQRPSGILQQALHVPAAHQFGNDVRRTLMLAKIEDRDDVRVGAHAPHRLRLTHHALAPNLVEAFRLDQRKGDIAIEQLIVREVDPLLPALAEEALDVVAAASKRVGSRRGGLGLGLASWSSRAAHRRRVDRGLGHCDEPEGVFVLRVDAENGVRLLDHLIPSTLGHGLVGLVEERIDSPLNAFAWHGRDDKGWRATGRRD